MSNVLELQQALAGSSKVIKFNSDIISDISTSRLVELDLDGHTLIGNVTYNTSESGNLNLSNGTIQGDLIVRAPQATVNNYASVTGGILINDVSSSTWNEYADGNSLILNDPDAYTHLNIQEGKTVDNLVLNSKDAIVEVKENASISNMDISREAAGITVTIQGSVANLNIDASDVKVLGSGNINTIGGAQTPVSLQTTVANHSPSVLKTIENQTAIVSEGDILLNIGDVFNDVDGDSLTYSVSSSNRTVAEASLNGNELTVKPVGKGTATIRIAAADGRGGKALQSFTIRCLEIASGEEIDVPIEQGNNDVSVDLSSYFSSYRDSDLQLKENGNVRLNGKELVVNPADGPQVLHIMTNDNKVYVVNIIVKSANHTPVVDQALSDKNIKQGESDLMIDASTAFKDEDGDPLTLTVSSSDPSVALTAVTGKMISVKPLSVGMTTVTVTADDGKGGTVNQTFTVIVNPASINHGPVLDKILTDQTRREARPPLTIDVSTAFKDEDGDSLTLTVSSSDTGIATATINEEIVSITPVRAGTTTITVTADDNNGGIVSQTFSIEVIAQGAPELFFSEYLDGGNGRIAVELFYKGDGNPDHKAEGYELEIHKYMKSTNSISVVKTPLLPANPGMTFHIIETTFYDFFDIINAWYYNTEADLYRANQFYTTALVLKKDGRVVDVLGNVNSTQAFLENGGTITRKKGIYTGSQTFDLGEWNEYPKGYFVNYGIHSVE
ncbi:Ig-like domain-containing protein [Metabacillus fastidiosus]|uniref:Ig-like domain-containing protein n=1 Tax=Metabacillus fastidiosus TaxID=1458 RepID=UPI003D29D0F1